MITHLFLVTSVSMAHSTRKYFSRLHLLLCSTLAICMSILLRGSKIGVFCFNQLLYVG